MPLKEGRSKKVVGQNIKEMVNTYRKTGRIGESRPSSPADASKQATAIALKNASKPSKMSSGGAVRTVRKRDGNYPVKIY
jgi:hypothetical protein